MTCEFRGECKSWWILSRTHFNESLEWRRDLIILIFLCFGMFIGNSLILSTFSFQTILAKTKEITVNIRYTQWSQQRQIIQYTVIINTSSGWDLHSLQSHSPVGISSSSRGGSLWRKYSNRLTNLTAYRGANILPHFYNVTVFLSFSLLTILIFLLLLSEQKVTLICIYV